MILYQFSKYKMKLVATDLAVAQTRQLKVFFEHIYALLHRHTVAALFLSTLIFCLVAYVSSITQLYPHCLAQILWFCVTCGVKMIPLRHCWGWQPPQTASHILIRHVQSVWSYWYVIHWHTVAAFTQLYPPDLAQIVGHTLSLVESNDVIYSCLSLTATSNCFPHPY